MDTLTAPAKGIDQMTSIYVYIDKDWNTKDFKYLFNAIEDIIELINWNKTFELPESSPIISKLLSKLIEFDDRIEQKRIIDNSFYHRIDGFKFKQELEVKSIQYNSPGWVEFGIMAGLAIAVLNFIQYYVPNRSEKLKQIELELRIKEIKKKNLLRELKSLKLLLDGNLTLDEKIRTKIRKVEIALELLNDFRSKKMISDFKVDENFEDEMY